MIFQKQEVEGFSNPKLKIDEEEVLRYSHSQFAVQIPPPFPGVLRWLSTKTLDVSVKAKLKADKFKSVLEKKLAKPDPKHPQPKKLSKTDAQLLLDMLNKLLDNLN